jgi:hypothetical protein
VRCSEHPPHMQNTSPRSGHERPGPASAPTPRRVVHRYASAWRADWPGSRPRRHSLLPHCSSPTAHAWPEGSKTAAAVITHVLSLAPGLRFGHQQDGHPRKLSGAPTARTQHRIFIPLPAPVGSIGKSSGLFYRLRVYSVAHPIPPGTTPRRASAQRLGRRAGRRRCSPDVGKCVRQPRQ